MHQQREGLNCVCLFLSASSRVNLLHLTLRTNHLKTHLKVQFGPVLMLKPGFTCVSLCRVQVSLQRSDPGPGSRPSVPAGCLLHPTFLQGASSHVSRSTCFLLDLPLLKLPIWYPKCFFKTLLSVSVRFFEPESLDNICSDNATNLWIKGMKIKWKQPKI